MSAAALSPCSAATHPLTHSVVARSGLDAVPAASARSSQYLHSGRFPQAIQKNHSVPARRSPVGPLGESQVVVTVAAAQGGCLPAAAQSFAAVLPHRLQHAVAGHDASGIPAEHRLVDQPGELFQHRAGGQFGVGENTGAVAVVLLALVTAFTIHATMYGPLAARYAEMFGPTCVTPGPRLATRSPRCLAVSPRS
ncbi:hypothetical protein GTS_38590 [Gandjariella thermophila]|uniref:Uncharacterized protein n=1 Tax=Gandjariella thermophila TaxID=1931992 RepID=A0A4D4JCV4_9PSEU|nr:hypothetical protein GTS_38590 [Gandjariella thermophila]